MLIVGIDPHKSTHTAVVLDSATGEVHGELTIESTPEGYAALLEWCRKLRVDLAAVENFRGLGLNLGTWLVAQGMDCRDITAKEVRAQRLSRRGGRNKNDPADALAAALAAATGAGYPISADEHGQVAALLTDERECLNAEYTAKRNRLHAHCRALTPGGAPTGTDHAGFESLLDQAETPTAPTIERHRQARALLSELEQLKRALRTNELRMRDLVTVSGTTLPGIDGLRAIASVAILSAVGDIDRFDTEAALAAFAGAAPRQIASGNASRHRLDRHGNYQLRRSLHVAAMTQARMKSGAGRAYYLRKREEGKSHREALRCLKRQLIKVIWRTMKRDANHRKQVALAA